MCCCLDILATVNVHAQNVDTILQKYAGKERKLLEHLRKKYTDADDPKLPAYDFYSVLRVCIHVGYYFVFAGGAGEVLLLHAACCMLHAAAAAAAAAILCCLLAD